MAPLFSLTPGTRFRYPDCGKTATLVQLGAAGARVLFDGTDREVSFDVRSGDEVVATPAFVRPGRPVLVSDASIVEVL